MENSRKSTISNIVIGYGFAIALILMAVLDIFTRQFPGTYCYEVIICNENNGNQYVLPAEIHYMGNSGNPEDGFHKAYGLNKVYWPNGGYTSFGLDEVVPNKAVRLLSEDEKWYNVKMTLNRASHPDIIESEDNSRLYELRYSLIVAGISVAIIVVKIVFSKKKFRPV